MQILVKFPTRNRWAKFLETINGYIDKAKDNSLIHYVITKDIDDVGIDLSELAKKARVTVINGLSSSKIHACNRNMDLLNGWDICVLASDDMICQVDGWDEIIREKMKKHFPDTDGVLHFNDGYCGKNLNTMCILGRAYYNRFGYIYHPDYISLWCDNEFQKVSERLGKAVYFDDVLFKHQHPANGFKYMDNLYRANDKFFKTDQTTYLTREKNNFDLKLCDTAKTTRKK
jgi:hypothetical protein